VLATIKNPVLNKNETLTLLELFPKTGRTHQIRVHLKYFNHPIFADFLYAGRKTARDDRKILNRVFLHAHKITFMHPITKKEISIESPLPLELAQFIKI
jgi:23S rRNA-/tRNA-specific pseudouridylate synthase